MAEQSLREVVLQNLTIQDVGPYNETTEVGREEVRRLYNMYPFLKSQTEIEKLQDTYTFLKDD